MITAPPIICRSIEENDLDAVTDLLVRGFSQRPRHYWERGFARLKHRRLPADVPRYGLMLDCAGKPVGVMLMLFSPADAAGGTGLRCNLSSWHVDPAFSAHTGSLVLNSLRRKAVTYTNLSAARHTRATVEAVKFVPYTTGYRIVAPAARRPTEQTRVHILRGEADAAALAPVPEIDLLIDHAAMGCLCLVVEAAGAFHPFVFMRFRIGEGRWPLPIQQLIFCRDIEEFVRFAGPLGRALLRRGHPVVIFDTDGREAGLPGLFRPHVAPRYFRGRDRPRLGDLAYSERVIFGP